jgi:hypothetical protein
VAVRYAVPEAPYAWPDAETADEDAVAEASRVR